MLKKIIISILTIAVCAAMTVTAFAADPPAINNVTPAIPPFLSYSGTVSEITEFNDRILYRIEKDNESVADIMIDTTTYIEGSQNIKKGDLIEAFYYTNMPMMLIYPPRVTAAIVTVNLSDEKSIKVDRFEGEPNSSHRGYLSSDGRLLANFSSDSKLVWQDGTEYNGDIHNGNMAVIYTASTRSIPAKTTPVKAIVFFEKESSLIEGSPLNGEIIVDGNKIENPMPYIRMNKVVMIPLRAVAEELGYDISWDGETSRITLNDSVTLGIGESAYHNSDIDKSIKLDGVPVLIRGRTYVPMEFFTDVLQIENARVLEGRILIDSK